LEDFEQHSKSNEDTLKEMLHLATRFNERLEDEKN